MNTAISSQKRTDFLKDFKGFAQALTDGAMCELLLTPKPGLVDRDNSGSHPDLTFEIMELSVRLLPQYFHELGNCCLKGGKLQDFRTIGLDAEKRMLDLCRSNTHKGYIFLGGLVLLSHIMYADMRTGIMELSEEFFPQKSGSIASECKNGLPAVFLAGIPALKAMPENPHYALACIMERTEDSTSLRRCGKAGLDTIRHDGRTLRRMIESGQDTSVWLASRNKHYKSINLTMGGCADLLALSFALSQ